MMDIIITPQTPRPIEIKRAGTQGLKGDMGDVTPAALAAKAAAEAARDSAISARNAAANSAASASDSAATAASQASIAATQAGNASVSASDADSSAATASTARDEGIAARDAAVGGAATATAQATIATTQAGIATVQAGNSANGAADAMDSADAAASSATQADTQRQAAQLAATNAATAKAGAEIAQAGAEGARDAGEVARDAASASATAAATSESNASASATAAQSAEAGAETARGEAQSARDDAGDSAGAASTSETNAAGSADAATTQAGIATTKAGEAVSSALSAADSASAASGSASTAGTQAGISTTQAGIATGAAGDAEDARDASWAWSSQDENTPVDDGTHQGFSSFHWSEKAKSYAGGGVQTVNGHSGPDVVLEASDVDAATVAQGALADSSVQPEDLSAVATSGEYDDLSGKPTLGTAAGQNVEAFATEAEGSLAATAMQPSVYDPGNKATDAFNRGNHAGIMPLAGVETTGASRFVFGRLGASGSAEQIPITESAVQNTVPVRGPGGVIVAGTPTASTHATPKDYVDSNLALYQALAQKGVANGYAGLDGSGKVPSGLLPDVVLGALKYQGTWNAATNVPAIPAAAAANQGWYYMVQTGGSTPVNGTADWQVGDWIVSNGARWDKIDNTDAVLRVAGLSGDITTAALQLALGLGSAAYEPVGTFAAAAHIHAVATGSVAGFMSAADKTKLDTVTSGATPTNITTVGAALAAPTPSTGIVDGDKVGGVLSGGATLAAWTWATVKAWIKGWITKADVGLGSADNTADSAKPVSTDQAAAIAEKVSKSGDPLTGGFTAAIVNDGTKSSGTYTPTTVGGNYRLIVRGGAFTLAAPTAADDYQILIKVGTGAGAGAITFTGFTKVAGTTLVNTAGKDYLFIITKAYDVTHLLILEGN